MLSKPENAIFSNKLVLSYADESALLCLEILSGMGAEIIAVDPEKNPGDFLEKIKKADIFLETSPPGRLAPLGFGFKQLSKLNRRLILASITPFGQSGPYKDFKASDFSLQALGGWLSVTGTPENPVPLPGNQAYHGASLFAVNAILMALWKRGENGRGQYIDVSIMECVAATLDHVFVRYFYEGIVSRRTSSRTWNNTFDILPCKDGDILISIHRQWATLVELIAAENMAEDLADVRYLDRNERDRNIEHIVEVMGRWTRKHSAAELEELGQLMHFPWAAVKQV